MAQVQLKENIDGDDYSVVREGLDFFFDGVADMSLGKYYDIVFDNGTKGVIFLLSNMMALFILDGDKYVNFSASVFNKEGFPMQILFDDYSFIYNEDMGAYTLQGLANCVYNNLTFYQVDPAIFDTDGIIQFTQSSPDNKYVYYTMFRQRYGSGKVVYPYNLQVPYQIRLDKNTFTRTILGKDAKSESYAAVEFDRLDDPLLFDIATIKQYGLLKFLVNGSYALQKDDRIVKYYEIKYKLDGSMGVRFPLSYQFNLEDFDKQFKKHDFTLRPPQVLVDVFNGTYTPLNQVMEASEVVKDLLEIPKEEEVTKLIYAKPSKLN